jgi:hypothetical protein
MFKDVLRTSVAVASLFAVCTLAAAQTSPVVEYDNADNVIAIRNLGFGIYIYDVEFLNRSGTAIYGSPDPVWDFPTSDDAAYAVNAVVAILNDEGVVRTVGDVPTPFLGWGTGSRQFTSTLTSGSSTSISWPMSYLSRRAPPTSPTLAQLTGSGRPILTRFLGSTTGPTLISSSWTSQVPDTSHRWLMPAAVQRRGGEDRPSRWLGLQRCGRYDRPLQVGLG